MEQERRDERDLDREEIREEPVDRSERPADGTSAPLLEEGDAADLRRRWEDLQATFVDQPREAVEQADRLVEEVVRRVSEGLSSRRAMLEERWSRGEDASTEDLRLAMQSYRSFFERMLTTEMLAAG